MPRISEVPNIGVLVGTDTLVVDRPSITIANHTTVEAVRTYVNATNGQLNQDTTGTAAKADSFLANGSYRTASNAPGANQILVLDGSANLALPGSLGLGITSPLATLHVQGNSLTTQNGAPTATQLNMANWADSGSILATMGEGFPGLAIGGSLSNRAVIGTVSFHNLCVNEGLAATAGATIVAIGDTATAADFGQHLEFYTRQTGQLMPVMPRLRIASSGNVLVGTITDIGTKFTVGGNGNFGFINCEADRTVVGSYNLGLTDILAFNTAGVERMRLTASGNVLVGTATALGDGTAKLQVAGAVQNTTAMITADGIHLVKLTNRTGTASVKGTVVTVSPNYDKAVSKITVDVPTPIGVIYEDSVADGSEVWVCTGGLCEVYFIGSTTRGHLARGFVTGDAGYVSGQALSEATPVAPFSTDKHFYEIGHVTSARTGAGLAWVITHFN